MKKDLSVPWSPKTSMKFISAVTILMMVIGMVSSTVAFAAPVAEENDAFGPIVVKSVKNGISPPLRSITPIPPEAADGGILEIPSFPLPKTSGSGSSSPDLNVQSAFGEMKMPSTFLNFEGVNNVNGVLPPDTQGDVGPNHYVQMVNISFAIWDKSGTLLYGPANNNTLWSGFGGACETNNNGDPIVLYDQFADRWLMSQFALNFWTDFHECIAISQTPDPLGPWYLYDFLYSTSKLNDYPKFGVWPDGYYMSVNQFTAGGWAGAGVVAYDRDAMLAGLPATSIGFDLYSVNPNYGGLLPSDFDGTVAPPAGSPNYFASWDDSTWIGPNDSARIWEFHVDWANPANSTFGIGGNPNYVVDTSNVDPNMCNYVRNCIPQPGGANVDAISDRLMYRLQYRNFGGYETLVTNHTVDVGGDHAGIHWMELRDAGGGWTLHQDGVYAPDTDHRWMGSIAMDRDGNIALGYSVSSTQTYPSIRYTGRMAGDPLGTMPQGEASVIVGSGYQTHGSGRWGDYSMMSVDPVDDCTFWYTQEYYAQIGSAPWQTRVGAFQFPTCAGDVPDIMVDPSSFYFEVPQGDADSAVMTIHNLGGAELTFDMFDEETSSPLAYGEMNGTPPEGGEPDNSGAIAGWVREYIPPENPTVLTGVSVLAYGLQPGEADRLIALGATVDFLAAPADLPAIIGNYDVFYPAYDFISSLAPYQADISAYVQAGGGLVVQQPNVIGPVGMMPAGFEIVVSSDWWPEPLDALVFTPPAATHPITQSLTPADLSGNFDTIYDSDLGPGFTVLATHAVETSSVALAAGPYGTGCIVMHTGNFSPGAFDPGTDAYIDSMFNWAASCLADAPWLTENPTSGNVPPGGSQPVDVMVDSAGLGIGTYTADIVIFNNDPDENPTVVPVTLEVVPLMPDIEVDPDSLSSTQPPDTLVVQPLDIMNVGSADLLWDIFEEELPSTPQAGKGEWLYRSEEGVMMQGNSGEEALAYPSAYRWQPDHPAAPLNILIYADDAYHMSPNTFLDQALQILGLPYTAHYEGDFAGFETSLAGGPWDLVLFGNDNYGPPPTTWTALDAYVNGGGMLVFSGWTVGYDPFHPLFATLGITWVGNDTDPPDPVYWWVPGHPFFTSPESVPEFTLLTADRYGVYGQSVEPVPGFDALAGYTTPGPDPLQAAMILGNGNRTVFKGFLDGQNDADLDTDGLMDGVELWINMIIGLGGAVCTPGDIPWVSVNPLAGITPPGGTDTLDVAFDSTGLGAGLYNGNLCIASNDPDESLVVVPVELEVFVEPDIELTPDSLHSVQPVDSVRVEQLNVGNVGSADLTWLIFEDLFQIVPVESTGSTNLEGYSLSSEANFTAPTQETQRKALIGIDALVNDGSFENGPPPASAWTEVSSTPCEWIGDWFGAWGVGAFDGVFDFWGGGYCGGTPSTTTVSQSITVPVAESTLSFWYISFRPDPDDPDPDTAHVAVDGNPVWTLDLVQANDTYPNWVNVTLDLSAYAGQTVNLELAGISTGAQTGNIRFDFIEWVGPEFCVSPLDIPWITNINPPSGTTGPGGSTPVGVTFDSTGLAEGAYNGSLCVESNDPDEPLVVVPVTMDVTPPTGEADLWIEPPTSEVPILGETTVDIMVGDVTNLYGIQVDLAFDPTIVEVVGAQLTPGDCPVPNLIVVNVADNIAGTISYAASSWSPTPPCAPGGVVASITFRGLAEGTSPVAFTSWLLADTDGFPIGVETVTDGEVIVLSIGTIDGYVELQGRTDHSSAEVCAWAGGIPVSCETTDASGYYLLNLPQDTYDIAVEMSRYLDGLKTGVFVPAGGLVTLPSVKLLGGDANEDDTVNILDLAFIGGRFGLSEGDPGWDPQADINDDLTVNILDIVLAASNFLKSSPVPWP